MSFIGNGVGRPTIQPGQIAPQAVSYSNLDSTITSTGLGGSKNKIINGNFDVWQRGGTQSAATGQVYLADRFCSYSVGSTVAQSQQTFTVGQTSVPGEPGNFLRATTASVAGASNQAFIAQSIEGVRTFAGQQVTLSFYAKSDAARNMAIEFAQTFGTTGSPSAAVTGIGVTTLALTTSWQKFTVTANIPSIANKTITTNDNLQVTFWMDAGSNFNSRTNSLGQQSGTFDFAQVQLEAGPTATSFEKRPYAMELMLCQRYYEVGEVQANFISGAFASYPTAWMFPVYWKVSKRTGPTVTFSNVYYYNAGSPSGPMSSSNYTVVANGSSLNGVALYITGGTTNFLGLSAATYTANSEL